MDATTYSQLQSDGVAQPFLADGIVIDLLNTFQLGEAMKNLLKGLARYPADSGQSGALWLGSSHSSVT